MTAAPPHTKPAALLQDFESWCSHQRLAGRLRHGSSETVYRAMWQALAVWCQAQQPALRLGDLRGPPLAAYLASRTGMLTADGVLSPRYQQRLLSLVQRVQRHQAWARQQADAASARSGASRSPAGLRAAAGPPSASTAMPTSPPGPTEAPGHLRPDQVAQLLALLCQAPLESDRWQTQRDRCAVALQLGAGLGPGDVRALRLSDVLTSPVSPARLGGPALHLRVPASGSAPAHAAPVAVWAAALLQRWLALRAAQSLGGPWLFPSTRSGKPWGKVAQYEAARRVLVDAGLDADAGGSFRLRHSFALRQLHQGLPADAVARWLGVVDPAVMLRYQAAMAGWPAAEAAPAGVMAVPDCPV